MAGAPGAWQRKSGDTELYPGSILETTVRDSVSAIAKSLDSDLTVFASAARIPGTGFFNDGSPVEDHDSWIDALTPDIFGGDGTRPFRINVLSTPGDIGNAELEDLMRDQGMVSGLVALLTGPEGHPAIFAAFSDSDRTYDAKEIAEFASCAGKIEYVLSSVERVQALSGRVRELEQFSEVARRLDTSSFEEATFIGFCAAARDVISFDACVIQVLDAECGTVRNTHALGMHADEITGAPAIPIGLSLIAEVDPGSVDSGVILTKEWSQLGAIGLEQGDEEAFHSLVAAPIIINDRLLGALAFLSVKPGVYDRAAAESAANLARMISKALDRRNQFEVARQERDEYLNMWSLALSVANAPDIQALYRLLHDSLIRMVPFDRFVIGRYDEYTPKFQYAYVRGINPQGSQVGDSPPPLSLDSVTDRWPQRFSSFRGPHCISADGVYQPDGATADTVLKSWLKIPLWVGGRVIGNISLRSARENVYRHEHEKLVERVAALVAPTMDRILAYDRLAATTDEQSLVARLINALADCTAVGNALTLFSERLSPIVPWARLAVSTSWVSDPGVQDEWVLDESKAIQHLKDEESRFDAPGEVVLLTRQSRVVHSHPVPSGVNDGGSISSEVRSLGLKTAIYVPLISSAEAVGVLKVFYSEAVPYLAKHRHYLEHLAPAVAGVVRQHRESELQRKFADAPRPGEQIKRSRAEMLLRLSETDYRILRYAARGMSNAEIAKAMHYKVGTIRNRLAKIYRVLGVTDRSGAVSVAMRASILH